MRCRTYAAGMISAVDGYKVLTLADILKPEMQRRSPPSGFRSPDNANDGSYRSDDGRPPTSRYSYDKAADF